MQATRLPSPWRQLLLLLVPLGLVLCVWQASQLAREQALDTLYSEARNELRLSAASISAYLSRHDYLPRLLASREAVSRALTAPDNATVVNRLNRILDEFRVASHVSDIYLLDRQGTALAASNWALPHSFVGKNYSFRPYFQDAIQGRMGHFYGRGIQSGDRGYYFSAPVWSDDPGNERVAGVMVVKVLIAPLERNWTSQNGELLISDEHGVVFMASQPGLRLASLAPLDATVRARLRETRRYDGAPLPTLPLLTHSEHTEDSRIVRFDTGPLAGSDFLSVARALPERNWQLRILKPLDSLKSAQWQAGFLAAGLYGVVVLAGGIGWQRRRLHRERQAQAQALARARDQLEQRVAERTHDLLDSNRRLSAEIDERRRAETNLRQTQDELIQAAKLAVLGQMAASINHELNQPLAAIRAYAENAQAFLERGRAEAAGTNLAQIVELTARMAEISAQLKQFSRKSGDTLAPISVKAAFSYALRLYHARIKRDGVSVEYRWPTEDVWVRADPVRLEQVLVNLIGNALQAMADAPTPRLILSLNADNRQVTLGVRDNGPGISEAHLSRVFEPFFTTKNAGKGLGLGLSISARIIEDLNGRLEACNPTDGGALFTIVLPACATPLLAEESSHA